MLLIELIALIFVIGGIVVLIRYNTWAGIAVIAVGVLIFLLRSQIVSSNNTANLIAPLLFIRPQRWSKLLS